jgi:hypothetical protein
VGFLAVHVSVVAHFVWRNGSRDWLRHLLSPSIGFLIVGYVLINAERNAKIAGGIWLAVGAVLFAIARLRGRSAALPVE